MRTLLIGLFLLCGVARAEVVAYTGNKSGGQIVLTDEQTGCAAEWWMVYTRGPDGHMLRGCWQVVTQGGVSYVHVWWSDGGEYSYLVSSFTINKAPPTAPQSKLYY
jgi:hypothetical protein